MYICCMCQAAFASLLINLSFYVVGAHALLSMLYYNISVCNIRSLQFVLQCLANEDLISISLLQHDYLSEFRIA